jgi:hypothetical protein
VHHLRQRPQLAQRGRVRVVADADDGPRERRRGDSASTAAAAATAAAVRGGFIPVTAIVVAGAPNDPAPRPTLAS